MKLPRARSASLVGRLVLLAAGWSLMVLIAAGLALSAFFQQSALRRFDQNLTELIDNLYAGSTVDDSGAVLAPALTDGRALRVYSGKYWAIAEPADGAAKMLVRSRSLWEDSLPVPAPVLARLAAQEGKPQSYDIPGPLKKPLRVVALQVRLSDREAPVIFLAAEDRTPVDKDVRRFAFSLLAALLVLGFGLLAAVFLQVRIGLSPLFALRREVAAVRQGRAERLVRTYPTELEPLAVELNALVAHNQEVVERQRTHVGNLAHALKTPLSVMLAEAQAQPGPLAEVVVRQSEAMRGQVDHHLRRARAAARSQSHGERTEVASVLDELSRTLERIFQDKGVRVDWDAEDELCFQGERQDFLEMVGNAMENACKWCRGRVRVTAEPLTGLPPKMQVRIEDDGPGLSPPEREQVLRRGERLDETAPGSGLGLAIVDDLARAYGGGVALGEARLGGLQVLLTLPRVES